VESGSLGGLRGECGGGDGGGGGCTFAIMYANGSTTPTEITMIARKYENERKWTSGIVSGSKKAPPPPSFF